MENCKTTLYCLIKASFLIKIRSEDFQLTVSTECWLEERCFTYFHNQLCAYLGVHLNLSKVIPGLKIKFWAFCCNLQKNLDCVKNSFYIKLIPSRFLWMWHCKLNISYFFKIMQCPPNTPCTFLSLISSPSPSISFLPDFLVN